MRCAHCPALAACKHTFGRFFADKSANGYGCAAPLTPAHAAAVERAIAAKTAQNAPIQADMVADRADADSRLPPREWLVEHEGRVYETRAKSHAAAVNFVRYRLYGDRATDTLPPFLAKPKTAGTLSRAELAARLKRIAG